ncbi:hypothetical protein N2U02_004496 [Salmonella enterica]|nr:hypothetical protein [Salmonella enterica]
MSLSGCASERPLTSYDDNGLCFLKGQAIRYGNGVILPRINAEFTRRGSLTIPASECESMIEAGKSDAANAIDTTNHILY